MRKENHVADTFLTEQHDAESIDPNADATGGWHAVLQRHEIIFIQLLLFTAGLLLKAFALFDGIVLLRVGRGNSLAIDAAFEDLHAIGILGR